jgi:hypothetical protein
MATDGQLPYPPKAEERHPMSKKIMLLALAVSAALFALPAMASANENHVEGATGKAFVGTGPEGSLEANGEPTIRCTSTAVSGSFTSETTGNVSATFETCSATILGISLHCRTAAEGTGVIKVSNVFHLITISTIAKPGVLITPPFPTVICGEGFSERKMQIGGNGVIGTVTSPACGASSASATIKFASTASSQEHKLFTGTSFDLTSTTEGSSAVTAGVNGTATVTFTDGVSRKQVCT